MSEVWNSTFATRMADFVASHPMSDGAVPVSIKIRATGCFHREHSPHAYVLIDRYMAAFKPEDVDYVVEEHESGPEILCYLVFTTAGITLAEKVIDLVTTIIKARSAGARQGESPHGPLKIVIRRIRRNGQFEEAEVAEIEYSQRLKEADVERLLKAASARLLQDELPKED